MARTAYSGGQLKFLSHADVEKIHDGRVFVTSEVGVGSTFCFELPLATAELLEVQSRGDSKTNFAEEK